LFAGGGKGFLIPSRRRDDADDVFGGVLVPPVAGVEPDEDKILVAGGAEIRTGVETEDAEPELMIAAAVVVVAAVTDDDGAVGVLTAAAIVVVELLAAAVEVAVLVVEPAAPFLLMISAKFNFALLFVVVDADDDETAEASDEDVTPLLLDDLTIVIPDFLVVETTGVPPTGFLFETRVVMVRVSL